MQTACGLLVFLTVIASAYGQYNYNATLLTNGVSISSVTPAQALVQNSATPLLYYLPIPTSANSITLTLSQKNFPSASQCSYVDYFLSNTMFRCSGGDPTDTDFNCYDGSYDGYSSSSSDATVTLYPGDTHFVAGGNLYVSILRESSSNYNMACPFTLTVNYSTCPNTFPIAGLQGVAYGDGGYASYTFCGSAQQVAVTAAPTVINVSTSTSNVYILNLPELVGHVTITAQFNDSTYVYGNNFYASEDGSCYVSTGSDVTTVYTTVCTQVRSGPFYVLVSNADNDAITGTITIAVQVCAPGTVGFYCNDTFFDANLILTSGVNLTLTQGQQAYGYVDFPNNLTGQVVPVFFRSDYSQYLYIYKGGFPSNSNGNYISNSGEYVFSPLEFNNFGGDITSGRYYFLVGDCNQAVCHSSISSNASSIITTGGSTTGSTPVVATSGLRVTTGNQVTTGLRVTTGNQVTTSRLTTGFRATTAASTASPVSTTNASFANMPSMIVAVVAILALMF